MLILLGTIVRRRHKIKVLIAVKSLHSRIPLVKAILASDFVAAREVVDFLKPTQVAVNVRLDHRGAPN